MLIKCPECELQVSDKAYTCPHCGFPMKSDTKPKQSRSNKRRRLPNGFGQISEIKGRNLRKPFRVMVTVGKTDTGRPICKLLKPEAYFETYNDAYLALTEYQKNPYDLSDNITVNELFERWSERYKETVSHYHWRSLERAWTHCSEIYTMPVVDLRTRHVKSCIEKGPSSIIKMKIKTVFNLMLDYAIEYELIDHNYSRSFDLAKDVAKDIRTAKKSHLPFTDEEMTVLWERWAEVRFADLILIQCYSGWRPQELLDLEIENIDLENWTFKGGMKTDAGKDRVVPIHSRIRELVKRRYDESVANGGKYLVTNLESPTAEKKLSYKVFYHYFTSACANFGLNMEHRPHDGRKHFVTMAKKYGVDEYAIKYLVGHTISDLTERVYTDRDLEWLQSEIEKLK